MWVTSQYFTASESAAVTKSSYAHTHTHTHVHITHPCNYTSHTHAHTHQTHPCTYTCTQTHAHTPMHTHTTHPCTHTPHTHAHTHPHPCTHTPHTHAHTHHTPMHILAELMSFITPCTHDQGLCLHDLEQDAVRSSKQTLVQPEHSLQRAVIIISTHPSILTSLCSPLWES